MVIFVSYLNFKVRNEDLKNLFEQYGEVLSTKVVTDNAGKSRGFGFVEMKNDDDGQRAISELNQKDFEGQNITVSIAVPYQEATYEDSKAKKSATVNEAANEDSQSRRPKPKNNNAGYIAFFVVLFIIGGVYFFNKNLSGNSINASHQSINPSITLNANGDLYITNNDNFDYPVISLEVNGYFYTLHYPINAGKIYGLNLGICTNQLTGTHFNPEQEKINWIDIDVWKGYDEVKQVLVDEIGKKEFKYQ